MLFLKPQAQYAEPSDQSRKLPATNFNTDIYLAVRFTGKAANDSILWLIIIVHKLHLLFYQFELPFISSP